MLIAEIPDHQPVFAGPIYRTKSKITLRLQRLSKQWLTPQRIDMQFMIVANILV
jgi:hypothetical protein